MSNIIRSRYLVSRKLGEGGMSDVYLATDTLLHREVAIKILRQELSIDPVNLLRFQREANAASKLNHPHIVEIFDVGEEDGRHYIVMEVVRGKTLKELIQQRGALDVKEAIFMMRQIISALAHAHTHNIIHRDIKPQNILVKDDGSIKIADFGIAMAMDATQLTQVDSVMGSVHYMAPECARGEIASVQSDVYALGVVFYELLSGQVPFAAEVSVQVALKHMQENFPSVRDINPTIPQSIENIIFKATAKHKSNRFDSANDMLASLDAALERKNEKKLVFEQEINLDSTQLYQKVDVKENTPTSWWITLTVGLLLSGLILFLGIQATSWFNRGPVDNTVDVPNIVGLTFSEAREVLEPLGLFLSTNVRYQLTDEIEFGKIISFTPGLNTKVERGTAITVWISDGIYFVVGDYVGRTIDSVQEELSGTRILIRVEKEQSTEVAAGTIIRQEILLPLEKLDPRRQYEIKLVVSTFVEIIMPSLIGLPIEMAVNQLESLGVEVSLKKLSTVGLTNEELEALQFNVVIGMSVTPGAVYTQIEGRTVELSYYE
jgi:eukaryotic-like serine/threonine-protein kinase